MMFKEIDDTYRDFIEAKMIEIDSKVYTDKDFKLFFSQPHTIIAYTNTENEIIAFCGILVREDGYQMCYTWCSTEGKKAYSKGIDYVVARYNPMFFAKGALKFNKIKRITRWVDKL